MFEEIVIHRKLMCLFRRVCIQFWGVAMETGRRITHDGASARGMSERAWCGVGGFWKLPLRGRDA